MVSESRHPQESRFNLVRWFSISGFLAIAAISMMGASYFSHIFARSVLSHDANVMTDFVNSIIRQDTGTNSSVSVLGNDETNKLAVFFGQLSKVPGILRANVYSPTHKVLWSSHQALVDKQFKDNEELQQSLLGKPVAHLEDTNEINKAEHMMLHTEEERFVEYYLPIWETETRQGEVVAVAEIYRTPLGLIDQLQHIKLSVWIASLVGGIFLFASLFWIVRKAANIIEAQDKNIIRSQRLVTIGEMASTVAHGLRNPLSSIRSSAELARENNNCDDTNLALDQIMAEADAMETWVRQYLSEIGRDDKEATCILTDAIRDAIQLLRNHRQNQNFKFKVPDHNESILVRFNCLILVQIISGLLSNAIEASPIDGNIEITIVHDIRPDEVTMEIRDRGIGITNDNIHKIFEPFFTTKQNGLGIGLSLTREILQRNGGSIDIRSDASQGTLVSVVLRTVK